MLQLITGNRLSPNENTKKNQKGHAKDRTLMGPNRQAIRPKVESTVSVTCKIAMEIKNNLNLNWHHRQHNLKN